MSKLGKIVNKGTYGVTGILMKPLYNMIKEERKADKRNYAISMKQAEQAVLAEAYDDMQPKVHDVHQEYNIIVHEHEFW